MTAVRELIYREIEARIGAIDSVREVERMPSGDPIDFNAIHLFDDGHQPADGQAQASQYDLALTIVGYVEGDGGAEAHAAINDLYSRVVEVLLPEPPLGGLAETIDEGNLRIDVAALASKRRLAFTLDLNIGFSTRRGRPAEAA